MVAYVHIEYSAYQFSEESKGVGNGNGNQLELNACMLAHTPGKPCGTEKSVVLRGLIKKKFVKHIKLLFTNEVNIYFFIADL